jgi:MSHA biogenesis protein MshK
MIRRLTPFLLLLPLPVLAQMADPTRPPASWLAPVAEVPGGTGENAGPRLQSVLIPERGRPVAVISGKTVVLGGEFDGAKLVGLTESRAVLRGPDGLTYLYLAPDVDKKTLDKPRQGKDGKAGRKKESR